MPEIETRIWLALKARIESLPLGFPRAWPGQTFDRPYDGAALKPYLRIGRVSASPAGVMIDYAKPHDRRGSLIVTLVHQLGPDTSVFDQYAATIAAHFRDGTQMRYGAVCVTVPTYPHVQPGYETDGYWSVPVNVPWRCFA